MRGSNGGTERVVGRAGHTSRLLSESIIADVRSNIAWIESRQEGVADITPLRGIDFTGINPARVRTGATHQV